MTECMFAKITKVNRLPVDFIGGEALCFLFYLPGNPANFQYRCIIHLMSKESQLYIPDTPCMNIHWPLKPLQWSQGRYASPVESQGASYFRVKQNRLLWTRGSIPATTKSILAQRTHLKLRADFPFLVEQTCTFAQVKSGSSFWQVGLPGTRRRASCEIRSACITCGIVQRRPTWIPGLPSGVEDLMTCIYN